MMNEFTDVFTVKVEVYAWSIAVVFLSWLALLVTLIRQVRHHDRLMRNYGRRHD